MFFYIDYQCPFMRASSGEASQPISS